MSSIAGTGGGSDVVSWIALGVAALAAVAAAVSALYAVGQNRAAKRSATAAETSAEASLESARSSRESVEEATKARFDATSFRLTVGPLEARWPPLLSGIPGLSVFEEPGVWHGMTNEDQVVLSRDASTEIYVHVDTRLSNDGAGSVVLMFQEPARVVSRNGLNFMTWELERSVTLRPNEAIDVQLAIRGRVKDWVKHDPDPSCWLQIIAADPRPDGIVESHFVTTTLRPLVAVPGMPEGVYRFDDVGNANLEVQVSVRQYRALTHDEPGLPWA